MVLYDQTMLRGGDLLIGAREKSCRQEAPPSVPRELSSHGPVRERSSPPAGGPPSPSQYNDWAGILKAESVMLSLKPRWAISTKGMV